VYADLPADDLPDEETDTPYVLLHSPGRENDRERNTIEYVLGLWLVLNVDTYNTRLEGTVTEPSGVELMCDFITKVQAAITAALPANFSLAFSIDTDTLGQKPEVHGFLAATFTQRLCLGTDPLA